MIKPTNIAAMTAEEALDACVELDVLRWGEAEREASRALHARKSRGLRINTYVHHALNDYGDAFTASERKVAAAQLTAADKAELRKGG